jgi:hypothetical protein
MIRYYRKTTEHFTGTTKITGTTEIFDGSSNLRETDSGHEEESMHTLYSGEFYCRSDSADDLI